VKSVPVEQWLKSLALAPGSKAKIRNIMSALYSHAIRWEWATHNSITHVRQSAKRSKTPVVLTIEQIKAFLSHLEEPCRTAVLLDAASGLRVGELLGLKWEDVDFEALEVNVTRSVVKQKITRCKTEASRKPIPLDAELAEVLLNWKLRCAYPQATDWVFASPHRKGKQPYWPGSLFRVHLKPALEAAEIPGKVGWHTLRHTFGTLMKANGEDIKTIQELLPFELQSDRRHVHTSRHSDEARSANKACQNDPRAQQQGRGKAGVRRPASEFYRTLSNPRRKGPIPINHLFCWRPRRDLNPCYRRERAMS
jgi:integrase